MIWEYLKYEIRKFSNAFSKQYAIFSTKTFVLEKTFKTLKANANFHFGDHYLECKNNLEQIHQEKANGINKRNKYDWYKFGDKFSYIFL